MLVMLVLFSTEDEGQGLKPANVPSDMIARFICAMLLHVQLEGEVRRALSMIKFYNNHPDKFINKTAPVIIPLMQLSAAIFTEFINILLICSTTKTMNIIKEFIALGVIAQIDDFYA